MSNSNFFDYDYGKESMFKINKNKFDYLSEGLIKQHNQFGYLYMLDPNPNNKTLHKIKDYHIKQDSYCVNGFKEKHLKYQFQSEVELSLIYFVQDSEWGYCNRKFYWHKIEADVLEFEEKDCDRTNIVEPNPQPMFTIDLFKRLHQHFDLGMKKYRFLLYKTMV